MYNKLFSKIVDSSIWMEADHVRLIWLMFIAIMDEDGFVNLASVKNVAHRAVMDLNKAENAIDVLESPDENSSNPANEGRRLTRVPGGWVVNNAQEYRAIVKREHQKELNRERVRRHRNQTTGNAEAMVCNADVTHANETVTPSDTDTDTDTNADAETEAGNTKRKSPKSAGVNKPTEVSQESWDDWKVVRKAKRAGPITRTALKMLEREAIDAGLSIEDAIAKAAGSGWVTFKAEYLRNGNGTKAPVTFAQQSALNTKAGGEKFLAEMQELFPDEEQGLSEVSTIDGNVIRLLGEGGK